MIGGRPPTVLTPAAGDDAYSAAHRAVVAALESGEHTPNAHVLAGAAVTAAAPLVQVALLRRLIVANTWRTARFLRLQLGAAAAGFLVAIGYALFAAGSWALAAVELALFAVMLHGTRVVADHARAERARAKTLLGLDT